VRRLAELGLYGEDTAGYGCPGMSPLARGLMNMELHRGDGSLGTFLGVQSGLAMKSIALLGSDEQKQRWLPAMARLDAIGAFALTEPTHGSDSVALETSARRDGDGWVLDGAKRWIGNGVHDEGQGRHPRGHRDDADADRRARHHRRGRIRLSFRHGRGRS